MKKPFITFGYGISAYLTFLYNLILIFTILTILSIPIMLIYYDAGGYKAEFTKFYVDRYTNGALGLTSKLTLGNFGYSHT